ncbi:MAG: hypothetical protein M4D80_40580 [Myxococcota bacterium]|nr:hypothetical protein [Myxococcota bacterium]
MATPRFDAQYYQAVIEQYGYDALDFSPLDFGIGSLDVALVQRRWLCHHGGRAFLDVASAHEPAVVTTGFGLSGSPHIGTLGQILSAILLQRAGMKVQIVLGDLDAYNARSQDLKIVAQRVARYSQFILELGFDPHRGILRDQRGSLEVLETAYLSGRHVSDADFLATEEDLSQYYVAHAAYPGITFPVKLAILLMIADFITLHREHAAVLVMLGIDEHRYVRLARKGPAMNKSSGQPVFARGRMT